MTRTLSIIDTKGPRDYPAGDKPWSLGGGAAANVPLDDAPDGILAYIGYEDGHFFVQGIADGIDHNGKTLSASAWLKDGDWLDMVGRRWLCRISGEQVRLEAAEAAPALKAPSAPPPAPQQRMDARTRKLLGRAMLGVFALLLAGAGFVLLATPVRVEITPQPETVEIDGFLPLVSVAGQPLALPGSYRVRATLTGYHPLDSAVTVRGGEGDFAFTMEKLPGRLTVNSAPVSAAVVTVDGELIGETPLRDVLVPAGPRTVEVTAPRYLPASRIVEIIGMDQAQGIDVTLEPAWAVVHVSSSPADAEVTVDGVVVGRTPVDLELLQGNRRIEVGKPLFETAVRDIAVEAGVDQQLPTVALTPSPARVRLVTAPAGATVTLNDTYLGRSPLDIEMPPNKTHILRAALPGHQLAERRIRLGPTEEQTLALDLEPEYGTVFVSADPPDALLTVDGEPRGAAVQRLRLTTVPHRIEISMPGYVPYTAEVTPKAGLSDQITITLQTEAEARRLNTPASVTTGEGQALRLVTPGRFTMGSSRREVGRRANERAREVLLTRRYYLSEHTVTNGEYRRFKNDHAVAAAGGKSLNLDDQPAVSVSWDDAARYLNWLSARDNLPAAYVEKGGAMMPASPPNTGYRLPSEAEWAWAARMAGRPQSVRFAWGGTYPPTGNAGNFADESARGIVPAILDGYNDGQPVSAPVGRYPANPAGFFDLGSNVAEWCHDFYDIYAPAPGTALTDPVGPPSGTHHVVRGASWRAAGISRLRLSYRDYASEPRIDLGFRIARTADSE